MENIIRESIGNDGEKIISSINPDAFNKVFGDQSETTSNNLQLLNSGLKWLGVDLDDTIFSNTGYPDFKLTDLKDGAKEALTELEKRGWKIVIYTARAWSDFSVIKNWLKKHQIHFEYLVCGKLLCRYFIDDRNIEFNGDWKAVLEKVKI